MAGDPYKELGVSRTASAEDIRKAFRKLAKAHHPDANPGNKASEERFKRVSGAFDIIGDPDKRRRFDAGEIDADGRETPQGFAGFRGGPGSGFGGAGFGGAGFGGAGPGGASAGFEGVDLGDILGEMFSGGRGAGGARGFRPGGFNTGPAKGADVRGKLEIDLEDVFSGAKHRLAFTDGRTLDVTVPKGVGEGQVLRLRGQGSPGRGGPGDALIEIAIRPHPIWRREGDHLYMDLPVSVPDAVLGGKVEAQTPDGPVTVSVPKGANSGATLRLRGRGLPLGKDRRGDLLARLVVTLPETPDPELERFAQTWRAERPYTPRVKR
ncbi:MAG: J domain-containing protein [Alphaproteobacteria bacterium]|nr:J domain-containing protein [Alphaproteobacteria bacterium]